MRVRHDKKSERSQLKSVTINNFNFKKCENTAAGSGINMMAKMEKGLLETA